MTLNIPAKPFSSGTEYEIFKYNYCDKCKHHIVDDRGYPALVEDGGCPIEDGMEYARFDISVFPSEMIRELRDEQNNVTCWHSCAKFEARKEQTNE